MATVTVDAEDLLVLVRACKEHELDARAHRATWTNLRLAVNNTQLDSRYADSYRAEREQYAKKADWKYAPIVEAIQHGLPVADALKRVADQMRR
jgi:hypothetical protein